MTSFQEGTINIMQICLPGSLAWNVDHKDRVAVSKRTQRDWEQAQEQSFQNSWFLVKIANSYYPSFLQAMEATDNSVVEHLLMPGIVLSDEQRFLFNFYYSLYSAFTP